MRSFAQMTLPLVLIMLLVAGCGRRSEPEVISEPPSVPRQDIKPSPTEVVAQFLNAIKSANYAKAYKYVNAPYTDRDGYINQMKNTLSDNDFSLQSYRMLGTQIYDRTSTVVVELSTTLKSPRTGGMVNLTQKSQYSLGIFEGKWLITSDNCIEGCLEKEPVIEVIE